MSRIPQFISFCVLSTLLVGCVSSNNIQSFECTYGSYGEARISETIALYPVITTKKGIQLTPLEPSSTQIIPRSENKTSKTLKEYDIAVSGGKRRPNTNIIDIGENGSLEINKRLQVIITLRKKPSLKDTIEIVVSHQGPVALNFDAQSAGQNANDVLLDVQRVHDQTYFENFNCDLYLVNVTSGNRHESFYMSEKNSTIFISNRGANGANGSAGADGNNGANGRDGIVGTRGRAGSSGGEGGNGGDGGNAGNGGKVVLSVDADSFNFGNMISINNSGGTGGIGGIGGMGGMGGEGGTGGDRVLGTEVLGDSKLGGRAGAAGHNGFNGLNGLDGQDGPPIQIIEKEMD